MTGMSRREFLSAAIAGSASVAAMGSASVSALAEDTLAEEATIELREEAKKPPNFVVVFIDDLGYSDLGCFGSPLIKTPRLDRMADEGVKFTSFYAQPICSPSRASLLTGCLPMRVSIPDVLFPHSKTGINSDEITIAEILKDRGYTTACIGKWHLGHQDKFLPRRHGFDYFYGLPYSNDMDAQSRKEPQIPLMRNEEIIEQPANQAMLTERYTDEAIKFIKQNKDNPFFLYLPHTMVHVPLHASEKWCGVSKRGLYGDTVECIDWSTGEILDTLAELGLEDNTLVIFTSDNGPWLVMKENGGRALPLREGKGTCYEGGLRVPTIMRWPGRIPAGSECSETSSTMDILPTFAHLAGAEVPQDRIIDGRDILPLITGEDGAKTPHEAFFYYMRDELRAVRSGKWKLVVKPLEDGKPALYDLESDISESNNLASENPDVVMRLQVLLDKCREDIGDSLTDCTGKNRREPGRVG